MRRRGWKEEGELEGKPGGQERKGRRLSKMQLRANPKHQLKKYVGLDLWESSQKIIHGVGASHLCENSGRENQPGPLLGGRKTEGE